MKAAQIREIQRPLMVGDVPDPVAGPGEVLIHVQCAALNRRDYWITQGLYPGLQMPCIPGSDAAGIVLEVGDGVDPHWRGQSVLINPGLHWGPDPTHQSNDFSILGMPTPGTLAEEVVVPAENIATIPPHLDVQRAAALPLAGVTAYRALFTQGKLQKSQTVLISGIGGGVAAMALQFAVASGAEVFVSSSSPSKIEKALWLGARGGVLYTEDRWHTGLPPVDLIIDGAGGSGCNSLLNIAKPGARIVHYGMTAGAPTTIDFFKVFWKQLHIIGSTMGSPEDFQNMLRFVTTHKIKPLIHQSYPLDSINQAIEQMAFHPQFGKIIIPIDIPR